MKIAEENNLFDDTYYQLQEKVHQLLKTHYYFNTLAKVMNYSHTSSELLDCMAQLMTCNGLTVNADYKYNYLKKALKDDAEKE